MLGHEYRYFETDEYKYKQCNRCGEDELLGKSPETVQRELDEIQDRYMKILNNMSRHLNTLIEETEDPEYTSKW